MDYELQLKIKNAPLLNLMRASGYNTAAELSRACDVDQTRIGDLLNLKRPLYTRNKIPETFQKIADFLCVHPEELVPPNHLHEPLTKNQVAKQVYSSQLQQLSTSATQDPAHLLEFFETESRDTFVDMIKDTSLTDREKRILTLYFQEEKTYKEIGNLIGVTAARIRIITHNALRKLRRPTNITKVKVNAGFYANYLETN